MTKFAVLISGVRVEDGYDEFWNDVVRIRDALLKNDFKDENIHVLYGDGKDYDNPNRDNPYYRVSITTGKADINGVKNLFTNILAPALTNTDLLFIWTFGHGRSFLGTYYLVLYNEQMNNKDFANLVNSVKCVCRVVCMQQCFSGGFIQSLTNKNKIKNNIILTACSSTQVAQRCDDQVTKENEDYNGQIYNHGEFNFHLFSVTTNGTNPTIKEIFDYIKANNSIKDNSPQYSDCGGFGQKIRLK
jgi:hypothetical protein